MVSAVGVTFLLAAATACGGGAAPASAPASPAPAADDRVRLLEPGAEPRDVLRFVVVAGARSSTTMTIRTSMRMTVDGQQGPKTPIPSMTTDLDMTIDAVAPNGDVDGHYTMDDFRVGGPAGSARTAMQKGVQQLDGIKGTFTMSPRGESIHSDITAPPGLDPALAGTVERMSSQVASMAVPFPTDPVGLGGRWTTNLEMTLNGVTTTTDFTYTLRERSGPDYVIDATYRQGGPRQENVALDGLPADTTADVDTIDITGTSTSTGSLTQLLPGSATVEGSGSMGLTVKSGPRTSAINQALEMAVELRAAA